VVALAAVAWVACAMVATDRAVADEDPRALLSPRLLPQAPGAVMRPEGWPRGRLPEDAEFDDAELDAAEAAGSRSDAAAPDADGFAATDRSPASDRQAARIAREALAKAVDKEKHVLSSIRSVPGAAIEPAEDAEAAAGTGVMQAGYDEAISLEMALVVARVGSEVVLESDLLTPKALEWLEGAAAELNPEQIRELRLQICRQVIDPHVETLLVFNDALREIPSDKLPEVRRSVDKAFDENILPQLVREASLTTALEYERSLRAKGQSLDRMRKQFFERGLAQEWLRKNSRVDEEIPHGEMIAWYQNNLAEFEYPARAKFEALTIKTAGRRSRQEAWDMLAGMGNEVLAGRPFAEVAKARSEGPTAKAGGAFDWTGKGSLASKPLDEAIFSLPVGELSTIIEDETALSIVRVVERQEAGRTPFLEAQVQIRQTLREDRRRKQQESYLTRLRDQTPVWTVFDEDGAQPRMAGRPTGTPAR
jgi:hypothetical protein